MSDKRDALQAAGAAARQNARTLENFINRCLARIRREFGKALPKLALVLGSGFQDLRERLEAVVEIPFGDLPGFSEPRVKGHRGALLRAEMQGVELLVCAGRTHFYEGISMETVMFPTRVMAECGVEELILTNAAGGINRAYRPGDFMLFSDHINFTGVNPLRGLPVEDGRCFVDLSDTYAQGLRQELKAAARTERLTLHEGVYLGVSGPSYETPAEINAFRRLGADAVGMSTIPEVMMARYCGLQVAAISCITNFAAGLHGGKLSHQDVLHTGRRNAANAARLLERFAKTRASNRRPNP